MLLVLRFTKPIIGYLTPFARIVPANRSVCLPEDVVLPKLMVHYLGWG